MLPSAVPGTLDVLNASANLPLLADFLINL
jgi:hypothetical protein